MNTIFETIVVVAVFIGANILEAKEMKTNLSLNAKQQGIVPIAA